MPPGRDETTARSTRPRLSVAMKVRSSSPSSSTKSAGPKVIRVVSAGPNGSASSQGAAAEAATDQPSRIAASAAADAEFLQPCILAPSPELSAHSSGHCMKSRRGRYRQSHGLSGDAVENRDIDAGLDQSRHTLEPGAMLERDRHGGLYVAQIADFHRIRVAFAKKRPCVAGGEGDRNGRYRESPAMAREQVQHWASSIVRRRGCRPRRAPPPLLIGAL